MKTPTFLFVAAALLVCLRAQAQNDYPSYSAETKSGPLKVTLHGHASLFFQFRGLNVYVDPFTRMADYKGFPKADLILITHEHGDHLDPEAVERIRKEDTRIITNEAGSDRIQGSESLSCGEKTEFQGIPIRAVYAYNILHKRGNGQPYHPKGRGNGYVIDFDTLRVYVAGDTENIPEMADLESVDWAFLPMNLPYTMSPDMVVDAVKSFHPEVLYPYHYHAGRTDVPRLKSLMKDVSGTELRVAFEDVGK